MAVVAPKWKGTKELKEQPGSPDWDFGRENTCTRTFVGPYATALAKRPVRGAKMADMPTDYRVDRVRVTRMSGGRGQMVVTLSAGGDTAATQTIDGPQLEIEWANVDKPIESHPNFKDLTESDREAIAGYFATSVAEERAAYKAQIGAAAAWTLFRLKLKGVESYMVFGPVVRKSSTQNLPATTNSCGQKGEPDATVPHPTGYQWLKTADRCTRSGRNGNWQRDQEWTGADEWSDDIYPVPEVPPA